MRRGFVRGALLCVALVAGCKRESTDAKTHAPPPSALPSLVSASPRPPPCRALRVKGGARTETAPVVTMTPLDGRAWVTLEDGADMVVRHGVTAREFSLRGPGRFLPCRGGTEQVLVASGRVRSAMGTGVRPGAEFSIATPFGSLSYGDADVESNVEGSRWQVEVRRGSVASDPVPGTQGLPTGTLAGPNAVVTATGSANPGGLVANCENAAREAAAGAERVLAATDKATLGRDAALQLTARRHARAACASAEAGLDREKDSARKLVLKDQLIAAERLWRTIPLR